MAKEKVNLPNVRSRSGPLKTGFVKPEHRIPPGMVKPEELPKVGVSNPYALAEAVSAQNQRKKLGKAKPKHELGSVKPAFLEILEWSEDAESNQKLVAKTLGCDYDKLFDPSNGVSPLFPLSLYGKLEIMPKIAKFPKIYVNVENVSGYVHVKEKPCSEAGNHWGTYKRANGAQAYYCKRVYGTKADIVDDAAQGCTKSCYFIAALVSMAWCKYPNFPANMTPDGLIQPSYTFTFYSSPTESTQITIDRCVVLDSVNKPVYARASGSALASDELWVAIYEKAYAEFRRSEVGQSTIANQDADCTGSYPNIAGFSGGNPLTALLNLTGVEPTKIYNSVYKDDPGGSFGRITEKIIWKDGTQGTTSAPMAAFTYDSAALAKAVHGKDIVYKNEIIVASHSYSILGVKLANSKKYVVLRNPYGKLLGVNTTPPFLPDPSDADFIRDYLYTGEWNPVDGFKRTLSLGDGIFALQVERFEDYFAGFGWVDA